MFDVNEVRKDFPMLQSQRMQNHPLVYLDNGATTFKPQSVIDAVTSYYTTTSCNIHRGDYDLSFQISSEYEDARKSVARFLNAEANEIVFTSGATAALNQIAYGYGMTHLQKGDVILTCEAEHASSILPWFKTAEKTGAEIEYIELTPQGELSAENVRKALHDRVKIVVFAAVSNVLGYKNDVKEITKIAHEAGAVVVCDGAQWVPHVKTNVKDLDVDFLAFSAHKCCGPTGIGVLYGKYELLEATEPLMMGGGANARFSADGSIILKHAPAKFEAGTPAIEAALGLKAAVEYLEKVGMDKIEAYEAELKRYAIKQLQELDHILVYNPEAQTGIVAFNVKDVFAQDAASYLNSQGIAVRAGNHCAKILVNYLKTSETIRASFYFYNTKEDVDRFVEACRNITVENCIGLFF